MAWFKKKDDKTYAEKILAKGQKAPQKNFKQKIKRFMVRTAAAVGVTSAAATGGAYYLSHHTEQELTVTVTKVTKVTEASCERVVEEVQSPKPEMVKPDAKGAPTAAKPTAQVLSQACDMPRIKYLIHTDKGVFENHFDPFQKKFQGDVDELQKKFADAAGKVYVVKVNGKEAGFLNLHRNILSAKPYVEPIVPSRLPDYFNSNPFENRDLNKNAQGYHLPLPPPPF